MKLILLKPEMRWDGKTYHAGDEFEANETGEMRAWFALGWVKKVDAEAEKKPDLPAAPTYQTAEIKAEPMTTEDNVLTPMKRRYKRRDLKAEE